MKCEILLHRLNLLSVVACWIHTEALNNQVRATRCAIFQDARSTWNTLLSHFLKRWQKEYLTELRVHHNCSSSNRKPTIKVGDVVFVYKDKAPRQLWSMVVVKSLITGRDGYHRGAVVTVRSGDRVVEITRPLNRLYPVEVESQVREERQNRNTDFPITFVGNAEQEHVSEH